MHDLIPLTPLGKSGPRVRTIGTVTLREVFDVVLASVAARRGSEADTASILATVLGTSPPEGGHVVWADHRGAVWMAAHQWLVTGALPDDETLAADLKKSLAAAASVTEQTDAWGVIDVDGAEVVPMFERLCPVPVRHMQVNAAQRTNIHQMGCFLLCLNAGTRFRVLSPRSSAGSLWHALETAARAVT